MSEIDWPALRSAAASVRALAYAPYSSFPVGAAALADDGSVHVGCNVENSSFGLTLCAECSLVSALVAAGRPLVRAVAVLGRDDVVLAPCGRCRQVLWEYAGGSLLVLMPYGVVSLSELLPGAFDASALDASALDASALDASGVDAPDVGSG